MIIRSVTAAAVVSLTALAAAPADARAPAARQTSTTPTPDVRHAHHRATPIKARRVKSARYWKLRKARLARLARQARQARKLRHFSRIVFATCYGDGERLARRTASGEFFSSRKMTAAHPSLPFGTHVRVSDHRTRRSVVVRINDRGPAHWTGVGIDLTCHGSAAALGRRRGRWLVTLQVVSPGRPSV